MTNTEIGKIVEKALLSLSGIENSTKRLEIAMEHFTLLYAEKCSDSLKEEGWSVITRDGYHLKNNLIAVMTKTEETFPELNGVFDKQRVRKMDETVLFAFTSTLRSLSHSSIENIREAVNQLLANVLEGGRMGGELVTPDSVNTLITQLVDVTGGEVYDGTAGVGKLLLEAHAYAARKNEEVEVFAQDINTTMARVGTMHLFIKGVKKSTYKEGDTLTHPQYVTSEGLRRFDYVLMNFPFGFHWHPEKVKNELYGRFLYGIPPKQSGDLAFMLHGLASMKETGRGAFLVPHGALFRGGKEQRIREELIQSDVIEGIIGLPENLFAHTAIPSALILVNRNKDASRRGKIFFMDASHRFQKERRRNYLSEEDIETIVDSFREGRETPGFSIFVSITDIEEGSLAIQRYFDVDDVDSHLGVVTVNSKLFRDSFIPKKELQQVADIYRGLNMPSKSQAKDGGTSYKVIQLTDVQNGEILWDQLQTIQVKDRRKAQQYLIREGDLILSARGSAIKTAEVPEVPEEVILSHNFVGLRPYEGTTSSYLKAYLESPLGLYYLTSIQKGSSVKVISIKDIKSVFVPDPPVETKNQIGQELRKEERKYREAVRQAELDLQEGYKKMYQDMGIGKVFEKTEPSS
ncbi:hypothetical protein AAV35_014030 (plasmid) [Salimicrobium jeotgali]|uniref:site-specific DNA-methyltransferase (adenine-specific) n=1 Tax=Salimicrobium jeotgali TaxID=1230341 RepID=K2FIG8_9BACI|nr:N-6 DNA methylase [Salimicrobium jeotgali]AKN01838.1 hypothetical protein AAV35_014030 [Salimicrobium jeotgali]EKE30891.1 N-6 DNA methylase [Salimicrobium jeotgali]MBM7697581.1 type I restriction enzyme M protein [Salimicrobium jeotgali]